MYEVELKVRADHDAVQDQLDRLDAHREGQFKQVDTYYDAPNRDFAATDEALRMRQETEAGETTTLLTYKGPLIEQASKTREEHETTVGDADATAGILAGLGFDPAAEVRKVRTVYAVEDLTVSLDSVDGLGTFVEVETDVETEAKVEEARERAADLLRDLGLTPADGIRASYLGLLLDSSE